MREYDVLVIGAGVAGMSAAIYLKRANVKFLLIEADTPGGQLNRSSNISNYPGFKEIDGPSLAYNIFEQVSSMNVDILYDTVVMIEKKDDKFVVNTKKTKIITKYVILALGRVPRKLNCENEQRFLGKGISYCALCDGNLYKDKEVVVLGGGKSALEETIYLTSICKKVFLVNKNDYFQGDNIEIERVHDLSNVEIIYKASVVKVDGDDSLHSIYLNNGDVIRASGLFVSIGYTPNNDFVSLVKRENNYIVVDHNFETSVQNIYACGDAIKKDLYQIVSASYEGISCAFNIIKKIRSDNVLIDK